MSHDQSRNPVQIATQRWSTPEKKKEWEAQMAARHSCDKMLLASEAHVFRGDSQRAAHEAAGYLLSRMAAAGQFGEEHGYLVMSPNGVVVDDDGTRGDEWTGYLFVGSPTASQEAIDDFRRRMVDGLMHLIVDLRDVQL